MMQKRSVWSVVRLVTGVALIAAVVGTVGCVSYVMPPVDMKAQRAPAHPDVLAAYQGQPPVTTVAEWQARQPLIRDALQKYVYGRMPPPIAPTIEARTPVRSALEKSGAEIEQITVGLGGYGKFNMILVTKAGDAHRRPVIVMENFCGNRPAFPDRPESVALTLTPVIDECNKGYAEPILQTVFGRHINQPPVKTILDRGYALAFFYAGDIVADVKEEAPAQLAKFAGDAPEGEQPGAIAVWAWAYSRAVDVLVADPRIDASRIAVWGHSRNGKSALLAAAFDPRIAAVIAHQSGKGGATLTDSHDGESVAQITGAYPHWFAKNYATFAGREAEIPVEQHQLLALIAPRPILLGNAKRDKWSDPPAAFRAAQGADAAYELLQAQGLDQPSMTKANLDARIAYFIRGGLHGVTSRDWREFLTFLDAHFESSEEAPER